MTSTSTHDTKRGEDARARLYTLTEAPEIWAECVERWRQMNQTKVSFLNDGTAPRGVDTWMLYQALAGVWPATLDPHDETALQALEARFVEFVEKALREAKLRTDWVDNNEVYETAVLDYARHLLSPENQTFLQAFSDGLQPFIRTGLVNSLTQSVIKLAAPGVPDIYQGSEALNFSLVDPDNRRELDFALLERMLAEHALPNFSTEEDWLNGKVKLQTTACMLHLRKGKPDLFRKGDYLPLTATGKRAENVIAFARMNDSDAFIMIAPRLVFAALHGRLALPPTDLWAQTKIPLPEPLANRRYHDILRGNERLLTDSIDLDSFNAGSPVLLKMLNHSESETSHR